MKTIEQCLSQKSEIAKGVSSGVALTVGCVDWSPDDGSWDLCPHLVNIEKVGPETLHGGATTHYTSTNEEVTKMGKDDLFIDLTLHYWLDEEGLLVQLQLVIVTRTGEYETLNRTTTKVSGAGDVNTITAPSRAGCRRLSAPACV